MVFSKSQAANEPNFRFDITQDDNLNSRFKPISDLTTEAIFSVDDDVIVPYSTLDFAFTVWQSAHNTMVGFVPRMHWPDNKKSGVANYMYGGWWQFGGWAHIACFFPKLHSFIGTTWICIHTTCPHLFVIMSPGRETVKILLCHCLLLMSNATGAPPIWVKGKVYEIGPSGISSLKGDSKRRNKCLNDFISLFG